MKKKPKRVRLTAAQSRSWVQFNYYSSENPKLTFEQVARKVLRKENSSRNAVRFLIGSEKRKSGRYLARLVIVA